jgi:general secretion pathway protein H
MTQRSKSAGFTLIELLVVMGITGLILAAVLSAKPNTAATRVTVAARAISATMQLARAQAMASNVDSVVRIDNQQHQFGLAGSMHALPRGMTAIMTVAETERLEDGGGIRFYPDGQSSGGEILLMLDARRSSVAVNWLTGQPD